MKIIKDNVTSQSKYMEIHSTVYEDNEGKQKEWSWVGRPKNTKAIMIIPIVEGDFYWDEKKKYYVKDNLLGIIKEFRISINDYIWEFPAGLIDVENESIEDCIKRELKEETGLDLESIYHITPFAYNSPGITDESIAMAFVKASGKLTKDNLESSEELESFLMKQEEVEKLLQNEKNFGAKALLIMKWFVKHNHII